MQLHACDAVPPGDASLSDTIQAAACQCAALQPPPPLRTDLAEVRPGPEQPGHLCRQSGAGRPGGRPLCPDGHCVSGAPSNNEVRQLKGAGSGAGSRPRVRGFAQASFGWEKT
eukprot:SAG22_NODE_14864_length_363_cov_0.545455_1_plen_112_part_01